MITNGEAFKLSEDCDGVIWKDKLGWHGCLKWNIEGNTNFVGPYPSRMETISAVRTEFARQPPDDTGTEH